MRDGCASGSFQRGVASGAVFCYNHPGVVKKRTQLIERRTLAALYISGGKGPLPHQGILCSIEEYRRNG